MGSIRTTTVYRVNKQTNRSHFPPNLDYFLNFRQQFIKPDKFAAAQTLTGCWIKLKLKQTGNQLVFDGLGEMFSLESR